MVCIIQCLINKLRELGHVTGTGDQVTYSDTARYGGTAVATLICILIYLLSGVVFRIIKSYRELSSKAKMFWNLAVVRGVYGICATIGGTYCRWFDNDLKTHMTMSRTEISNLLGIMHLGFFIYECTTQTYFDIKFKTFNRALHFHHLISLVASLYLVVGQVNHFYGSTMPFLEMSTPFSCICFCLLQLKMADSFIWKANQLILIHIFHMRTVYEALNLYEMYIYWDAFKVLPIGMIIVHSMGVVSTLFYLTPMWTFKKTEQFFLKKDFNDTSSKPEKKKE